MKSTINLCIIMNKSGRGTIKNLKIIREIFVLSDLEITSYQEVKVPDKVSTTDQWEWPTATGVQNSVDKNKYLKLDSRQYKHIGGLH